MTAASGDPGEKPQNEGRQPPAGGHEAPPIEQAPAYGGYDIPPAYPYPAPGAFPPPGQAAPGYPPAGEFTPQYGGYPPPPPPPPGYAPAPEYGMAYPAGYGYPPGYPPQTGTNKLAIGSIVASVIGLLCGIGSIVGIVLGAVAINQIKRSREDGYGLAVAGIVIGVASLVFSIIWMTYAWN